MTSGIEHPGKMGHPTVLGTQEGHVGEGRRVEADKNEVARARVVGGLRPKHHRFPSDGPRRSSEDPSSLLDNITDHMQGKSRGRFQF
jgi:hypothetical protein